MLNLLLMVLGGVKMFGGGAPISAGTARTGGASYPGVESPGVEHTYVDSDAAIQEELDRWTAEHANTNQLRESPPMGVDPVASAIIDTIPRITEAIYAQSGAQISAAQKAIILDKSAEFVATMTPILNVMNVTGQTGISQAIAGAATLKAAADAAKLTKIYTDAGKIGIPMNADAIQAARLLGVVF